MQNAIDKNIAEQLTEYYISKKKISYFRCEAKIKKLISSAYGEHYNQDLVSTFAIFNIYQKSYERTRKRYTRIKNNKKLCKFIDSLQHEKKIRLLNSILLGEIKLYKSNLDLYINAAKKID